MLAENQKVELVWKRQNKKYYEKLGYKFTNYGDIFYVDVGHLPKTSGILVDVICDSCGEHNKIRYASYLQSTRENGENLCRGCANRNNRLATLSKRQEKNFKRISDFCNEHSYILLSKQEDIFNVESEVHYICPKHGEKCVKVKSIFAGKICYECSRRLALEHKNQTTLPQRREKLFDKAIKRAEKSGYKILTNESDIFKNTSIIQYMCPKHGVHEAKISNFINGRGCPECAKDRSSELYRLPTEEVIKRISILGGELLNPEDYINGAKENLIIKCPNCGKPFTTSFKLFTQRTGQLCNDCFNKESTGEVKIKNWLVKNKIEFEQEKRFPDCKDVNVLPFDFYLPEYNLIIEFDGSQHYYEKIGFSNGLEYTQRHDSIKNEYCKNNNINLLRIPYWKFDKVDKILSEKTNELKLHKDMI